MDRIKRLGATVAAGAAIALAGTAVASATSTSSHHHRSHAACAHGGHHARGRLIVGPAAERAASAALAATGPGRVRAVRADGTGYRVSVVRLDGTRVHVRLGSGFEVLKVRVAACQRPSGGH